MNRQEWDFQHAACPKCGSTETKQTLIGVPEIEGQYQDDINTAECKCGWSGPVRELVQANTGQANPMPIRMLDFNGETFANTKDIVTTLLDFNKKLNNTLPREDMRKFTDAIFGEITQMFITVDKQHWVNKYNYQAKLQEELSKNAKDELEKQGGGINVERPEGPAPETSAE